jgi:CRISPR/Cas system-associated exonuclease Cas4 (RecB family)
MTTIIAETLDRFAQSQVTTFATDRSQSVGASEIGQCLRKTFWVKHEADPVKSVPRDPEYQETWGARLRGTMMEQYFWAPALRARFGDRLLYAGDEQETLVQGRLSATPDGLLCNLTRDEKMACETNANCIVLECKTIDPRANLPVARPQNTFQTQVQMGLFRATTRHRPERAVISYTDTSFWSETKEFVVKYDSEVFQAAINRADKIFAAASGKELDPEGWIAGGGECRYCPFTKPCGVERRNLPYAEPEDPPDPQFVAEMTDMARAYRSADRLLDAAEAAKRQLQNDIKNRLREKGVKKIKGVLSWTEVKGRTTYDTKAVLAELKRRNVDTGQYESLGEPSDRLTIIL